MGQPCAWIGVGSVNPAFVTSSNTYAACDNRLHQTVLSDVTAAGQSSCVRAGSVPGDASECCHAV